MMKQKAFDCVQMKWDIQRKLEAEFPNMDEIEKRRRQMQRAKENPVLGPIIEKIRVLQLDPH